MIKKQDNYKYSRWGMVHIQYQCQIYFLSREGGSSEMRKLKKAKSKKIFLRTMIIGIIGSYNYMRKILNG